MRNPVEPVTTSLQRIWGQAGLSVALALALPLTAGAWLLAPSAYGAAPVVGDATRGAQVYARNCTGCHALDSNKVGPAHRNVVGRKAGSAPGFAYSPALKQAGFVWDSARLDQWLTNPQAYVPGAKMPFRLANAQQRADVIAYLKAQSGK